MAKKIMKQAHGMLTTLSAEQQWDIVKKFDGDKNPFGGKTRTELESDLREMPLDELQRYATKLEIMPTNNIKILKQKIIQKYEKYARGLGRSPIQISSPIVVSPKSKAAKTLKDNLKHFAI